MIINVLDASREGVQVLFGHQKQQSRPLPLGLACPERSNVWSPADLPLVIDSQAWTHFW